MKITTIAVAALSLALLAACDKGQPRPASSPGTGSSATSPAAPSSANGGKTERSPVQGQVDPKEGAQNKDFKTDGK